MLLRAGENLRRIKTQAGRLRHVDVAIHHLEGPFGLPRATPALCVQRVAFTFHNRPVEVRQTFLRTDHYHYWLDQGG